MTKLHSLPPYKSSSKFAAHDYNLAQQSNLAKFKLPAQRAQSAWRCRQIQQWSTNKRGVAQTKFEELHVQAQLQEVSNHLSQ